MPEPPACIGAVSILRAWHAQYHVLQETASWGGPGWSVGRFALQLQSPENMSKAREYKVNAIFDLLQGEISIFNKKNKGSYRLKKKKGK